MSRTYLILPAGLTLLVLAYFSVFHVNQHEKAIADYSRAIELIPKEPFLYLGRGKSYSAINDTKNAVADFQKAVTMADKLHLKRQAEELLNKLTVTLEVTVN